MMGSKQHSSKEKRSSDAQRRILFPKLYESVDQKSPLFSHQIRSNQVPLNLISSPISNHVQSHVGPTRSSSVKKKINNHHQYHGDTHLGPTSETVVLVPVNSDLVSPSSSSFSCSISRHDKNPQEPQEDPTTDTLRNQMDHISLLEEAKHSNSIDDHEMKAAFRSENHSDPSPTSTASPWVDIPKEILSSSSTLPTTVQNTTQPTPQVIYPGPSILKTKSSRLKPKTLPSLNPTSLSSPTSIPSHSHSEDISSSIATSSSFEHGSADKPSLHYGHKESLVSNHTECEHIKDIEQQHTKMMSIPENSNPQFPLKLLSEKSIVDAVPTKLTPSSTTTCSSQSTIIQHSSAQQQEQRDPCIDQNSSQNQNMNSNKVQDNQGEQRHHGIWSNGPLKSFFGNSSSGISSTITSSASSSAVKRHISHPWMEEGRKIRFDPRVWVHEVQRPAVEKTWYSRMELDRFKHEAIIRIRNWAMKKQKRTPSDDIISTGTGRVIHHGGGIPFEQSNLRALYTNPALRSDAEDDEEEEEENGSLVEYHRPQELLKEIKTVLIVDSHDIFLNLLAKDIKILFPHVNVITSYTVQEAARRILIAKSIEGNKCSHGFDLIVVEERLMQGMGRSRSISMPNYSSERFVPSLYSGSVLIQKIANEVKMLAKDVSDKSVTRNNCHFSDNDSHDSDDDKERYPLLIGMSAYLEQDGKKLHESGADIVWGKPPPNMDESLRNHILKLIMTKRNRNNISHIFP